ncbi:MAG TPA: N-acetylmuramoyl-L-alanine amidase [Bacteroidia bacterium]|nr:N-acetylmuramoyl-L-alanine amidase [Bacteroidia bacterium]
MNRLALFSILILSLLFTSFSTGNKPPKYRIRTIVIDAGHGGHDTGCIGSSSHEKNIALAVSLKLGDYIEKNFPDIKVIYTRKTDVFIELHERAAIANRNKADLFICIHCNSGPSAAFGAETYVMGLHKTTDNLSVAKRENSSILLEKDYKTKYDGFDPNSPEANIIFSLYQNTFMNQSLQFASHVQEQFENNSGRFNRGVRQAGFLVLFRTAMPSVLIELGFLTNKSDEKYLISEKGQESMATSILKAFKQYKQETEKKAGGGISSDDQETGEKQQNTPKPEVEAAIPDTTTPQKTSDSENQGIGVIQPSKSDTSKSIHIDGRVFYTIQVGATANATPKDEIKFNKVPKIRKLIGDDGMTRFYSGIFDDIEAARKSLDELKKSGFKDAFICAFSGAKRISVTEAEQLLKRK